MSEWQPIETAPVEGKSFLVHCAERMNTYIVYRKQPDRCFYHFGGGGELDETPTFWLPLYVLPALPKD